MEKDSKGKEGNVIDLGAARKAAEGVKILANYERILSADGRKEISIGRVAGALYEQMSRLIGEKLSAAEGQIFLVKGEQLLAFDTADAFFAFLSGQDIHIDWCRNTTCLSKKEFFEYCRSAANQYDFISYVPMSPESPNVFYAPMPPTTRPRGEALEQLVSMFCPATDVDKHMILAAFVTPFWGSRGGIRPAFVIDAEDDTDGGGRGVGKSRMTDIIAYLAGGAVELEIDAGGDAAKKRILSAAKERIVRFDNVKEYPTDSGWIESLITAPMISGHQYYKGQKSLPNLYTYIFTFNGAIFSKDLAQRAVIIKLRRPVHTPAWDTNIQAFVEEKRFEIIADCLEIIGRPALGAGTTSRFALWEECIAQKAFGRPLRDEDLLGRQRAVDNDDRAASEVRQMFIHNLSKLSKASGFGSDLWFDPAISSFMIRTVVATEWLRRETNLRNLSGTGARKRIERAKLPELSKELKTYLGTDYWLWNPAKLGGSFRIDTVERTKLTTSDWVEFRGESSTK